MGRTIGRHWPEKAPRGDYQCTCDYCGVQWRRSQLYRDRSGLLVCPDEGNGKDMVTLSEGNAANAAARRMPLPNRGGNYDTTPYPIADKLIPNAAGGGFNWHMVFQGIDLTVGKEYECIVYAKAGGYDSIAMMTISTVVFGLPYPYATYNLETAEIVEERRVEPSITLEKGWYRCSYTVKSTGSGLVYIWFAVVDDGDVNFYGNDRDGVYAWGATVRESGTETNIVQSPNAFDADDWQKTYMRVKPNVESVDRSLL